MRLVFCVYGYSPEVERLQPWLTIHEVASVLIDSGWDVHLITDIGKAPTLAGIRHHFVKSMRPSNVAEMRSILNHIDPDRVVVLTTPLNLMFSGWYRVVRCPLIAFLSYPFYTKAEIARALRHLNVADLVTYGRHALVPKLFWAGTLRKYYSMVIAQSNRTARRVANAAGSGVSAYGLTAGLDLHFWRPIEANIARGRQVVRFLYVGSAKAIRGFEVLLNAFRRLEGLTVELRVLARGSTSDEVEVLRHKINSRVGEMREQVAISGGWMDRERYREELCAADVVVLPFVLVPSELPVSVIECIACGTPVISTDIDGLPEAVGSAGIVVRSGSVGALTSVMRDLASDPSRVKKLREHCVEARKHMLNWPEVGQEWLRVLNS